MKSKFKNLFIQKKYNKDNDGYGKDYVHLRKTNSHAGKWKKQLLKHGTIFSIIESSLEAL